MGSCFQDALDELLSQLQISGMADLGLCDPTAFETEEEFQLALQKNIHILSSKLEKMQSESGLTIAEVEAFMSSSKNFSHLESMAIVNFKQNLNNIANGLISRAGLDSSVSTPDALQIDLPKRDKKKKKQGKKRGWLQA